MALNVWEWDGRDAWVLHSSAYRARVCRTNGLWRARIEAPDGRVSAPAPFAQRQAAMAWVESWISQPEHELLPLPASIPVQLSTTRWLAPAAAGVLTLLRHFSRV